MDNARRDSNRARRPWRSRIDIVTEEGRQAVDYGYDPGDERPYWIEYPGPGGRRLPERFKDLLQYHEFVERQLAARRNPGGGGGEPPMAPPAAPRPVHADAVPAETSRPAVSSDEPDLGAWFREQRERLFENDGGAAPADSIDDADDVDDPDGG
jgi:hypothetical protein